MIESVLDTIKKMLGLDESYTAFDDDIVVLVNSSLMTLSQIGVVPSGTIIQGSDETWDDILAESNQIEGVKTYIYLKVRSIFDPPTSSAVAEAYKAEAAELEWRLSVHVSNSSTD